MKKNGKRILVIDGQGGRLGRCLVESILARYPDCTVMAVGTNSTATAAMVKGGAEQAATGENPVLVACRRADVIVGPSALSLPTRCTERSRRKWRPPLRVQRRFGF